MPDARLPSRKLADYLSGHDDNPDPSIQSWASFYIYDAAMQIIGLPDKEKRRAALGKLPTGIKQLVEAEIMRLWDLRG